MCSVCQAKAYNTDHIMLMMGGDFQYQNARINYKNIDKLIGYVNDAAVSLLSLLLLLSTFIEHTFAGCHKCAKEAATR